MQCTKRLIGNDGPFLMSFFPGFPEHEIVYLWCRFMKLFVKNIEPSINEVQLESIFAHCGKVISAKIVYDKITWESRGFAFVEMGDKESGLKAIEKLHDKELKGQKIIVMEAEERGR